MIDNPFYRLSESDRERILNNDNPCTIGGRCTDVAQIAHSLRIHVERVFPDGPPECLQTNLDELLRHLDLSGRVIWNFLALFILEAQAAKTSDDDASKAAGE